MARTSVESQLAKLRKAKEEIIRKEKALLDKSQGKALERITQLATENGISATQIANALKAGKSRKQKTSGTGTKKSRGKVLPKYRNPNNSSETWTGRGKSPLWAKALREAGKLDTALIAAS